MEQKQATPLLGTSHQRSSANGTMAHMINLRQERGVLRAITAKEVLEDSEIPVADYGLKFIHKNSEWSHWIGVTSAGVVDWYDLYDNTKPVVHIATVQNVTKIVSLKNFLILITDKKIIKYLFIPTSQTYKLVDLKDITIPNVYLSQKPWQDKITTLQPLNVTTATVIDQIYKFERASADEGKNVGMFWYRWAFRLYDGSHIYPSCPKLLLPIFPGDSQEFTNEAIAYQMKVGTNGGIKKGYMRFYASTLMANYSPDAFAFAEELKDIIVGIDIYASKPDRANKINADDITFEMINVLKPDTWLNVNTFVPVNELVNDIDSASWYLIQRYNIEDLYTALEATEYERKEIDLKGYWNNWATREILGPDTGSWHSTSGKTAMVYNSRLMLGDTSTELLAGYSFPAINWTDYQRAVPSATSFVDYDAKTITKLLTDDGEVSVVSNVFQVKAVKIGTEWSIVISGTIAYPDLRAKSIELVVKDNAGIWHSLKTFTLKTSENNNFAAYSHIDYTASLEYKRLMNTKWFQWQSIPVTVSAPFDAPTGRGTISGEGIPEPSSTGTITTDQNRGIVSGLNNPITYEATNSYRFGNGRVIGFTANTEALSQGQYGTHPVLVATTEGWWAMMQGNFPVLFQSVSPLVGDVALSDNFLPLRDSIIFLSDRGVMMLQGKQTMVLSEILNGSAFNPLNGMDIYGELTDNHLLFNSQKVVDAINEVSDIREYLNEFTCLGFDSKRDELVVFTPSKAYSWLFSLVNKVWYKSTQNWSSVINAWPESYVQDSEGNILDLAHESVTSFTPVLLQSNKIDTGSYNGIDCVEIEGDLTVSVVNTSIVLFGSEFDDNYMILGGTQTDKRIRNYKSNSFSRMKVTDIILLLSSSLNAQSFISPALTLKGKPKFNQVKS